MTSKECKECSNPITSGSKSGLCNPCSHKGNRAHQWKETGYSYDAAHKWIRNVAGKPDHCTYDDTHTSTKFEWSNNSGEYKRELSDWEQLCPSCHRLKDITDGTREKMSKAKTGIKRPNISVSIVGVAEDGETCQMPSLVFASEALGISRTGISNCLAGRSKTSGGFSWRYLNQN